LKAAAELAALHILKQWLSMNLQGLEIGYRFLVDPNSDRLFQVFNIRVVFGF
jgi:hypothetical protein